MPNAEAMGEHSLCTRGVVTGKEVEWGEPKRSLDCARDDEASEDVWEESGGEPKKPAGSME